MGDEDASKTDSRLAQLAEDLRRSEQRYAHLFQSTPVPLYLTDKSGNFVDANKAMLSLFGCSEEEIRRLNAASFYVNPHDRDALVESIERDGKIEDYEVRLRRMDGTPITCKITARKETDSSDRDKPSTLYLGIIRDITDKRQLDKLRLQQAKAEAFRVLVEGLGHDLNNLLAALIGRSHMLLSYMKSEEVQLRLVKTHVEAIFSSAKTSADVVARLQSGDLVDRGKIGCHSLEEIVSEAVVQSKDGTLHTINYTNKNGIAHVICDRLSILRVAQNLLKNAKDAMPHGGTIDISLNEFNVGYGGYSASPFISNMPPGKYYNLNVTDTGSGIAPEIIEKIFDPYFSTKPLDGGRSRGLGLATVRGLVSAHKGYITVSSRLGIGTTFSVYLPASSQSEFDSFRNPIPAAAAIDRQATPSGRQLEILIVDDEPSIGELVQEMLQGENHNAVYYSLPFKALEDYERTYASGRSYDLVFIDVRMPGLDGVELYKRLKVANPKVNAVFMSGHSSYESIKGSVDAEFEKDLLLLRKPFTPSELNGILSRALSRDY